MKTTNKPAPEEAPKAYTVDGKTYTRKEALRLIWRHTHKDYKGRYENGTRSILVYEGGTVLVEFDKLSDTHIMDKLPYCARKDARDKEGVSQ